MDRLIGEGVVVGHPVLIVDDQGPHLLLPREKEAVDDHITCREREGRGEGKERE